MVRRSCRAVKSSSDTRQGNREEYVNKCAVKWIVMARQWVVGADQNSQGIMSKQGDGFERGSKAER